MKNKKSQGDPQWHLVAPIFQKKKIIFFFNYFLFLIKRKLKDNIIFSEVLTAKIDKEGKLTAIENLKIQLERFLSSRTYQIA
jgi:hypothetical protein